MASGPFAKIEEGRPQPPFDPPHARHKPCAGLLRRDVVEPFIQQTLGRAVQHDHASPFARPVIQIKPALAHRGSGR